MSKVILCTGIDGEAKRQRIQEIIDSEYKHDTYPDANICIYSVGEKMCEEYEREKGRKILKQELLDLPIAEQEKLRRRACENIKEDFQGRGSRDVACILTRAQYFHSSKFWDTLEDGSHDVLKTEFCINLIDDIQIMHENMRKDPRWKDMELQRLLDWREDEFKSTEEKYKSLPTYLLAVKESEKTLIDLLFSKKKKAYLSFPITHASQQMKDKKREFVKNLREYFIVFDPISIEEYKIALEREEPSSPLIQELGAKTMHQDYTFIKQCDCIVVHYPTNKIYVEDPGGDVTIKLTEAPEIRGRESQGVFLSAGVVSEMVYARRLPRKVYAIWESKSPPSPFFSELCHVVFRSEKEFLDKVPDLIRGL